MIDEYNPNMINLEDLKEAALLYENNEPTISYKKRLNSFNEDNSLVSYKQKVANLKFLMRITRCILSVKDKDTQLLIRFFLQGLFNEKIDAD